MFKRSLIGLGLLCLALPLSATQTDMVRYTQMVFSVVVVVLVLGIGLLSLVWNYKHQYRGELGFWAYAWEKALVRLGLGAVLLVLVVNVLSPSPQLSDPYEALEYAQQRNLSNLAAESYRELIGRTPYLLELHYGYIASTYGQDDWLGAGEVSYTATEDPETERQRPFAFYQRMFNSSNPFFRDLALLGMGMCEYFEGLPTLARLQLIAMKRKDFAYRNLFLGRIYSKMGESEAAIGHFKAEMELGKIPERAVPFLAREYFRQEDTLKLAELMGHPEWATAVPVEYQRFLHVRQSDLPQYFGVVVGDWLGHIGWLGLVGALGGLAIWVLFLRRVDVFKRESWSAMLGMVLMGAGFSFVALPLYDIVRFELQFYLTGEPWQDFLYCVFGVGVIEELVKFLPFLIVYFGTNLIRGPLNFVLYASLSALGFSLVENLMYFDDSSITIMHGRVLIAVVFHMFASSTVAFSMVLARYRFKLPSLSLVPLGFMAAAFLHGVYDFWLLSPQAQGFFFLAYPVFIYATFQYASYLNNSLNHSPFFRGRIGFDSNRLATFLLVALVVLLLFEYLALSWVYNASVANHALFQSLGMGSFLMFFVVLNLSYIDIVQGEWFVLRLWNFGSRTDYNRSLGQVVELVPARPGGALSPYFPIQGEIIARLRLKKDNQYYLLELHDPRSAGTDRLQHVLLRAKESGAVIEPGFRTEVAVIVFRDKEALLRQPKRRSDFRMLDYALVK